MQKGLFICNSEVLFYLKDFIPKNSFEIIML